MVDADNNVDNLSLFNFGELKSPEVRSKLTWLVTVT